MTDNKDLIQDLKSLTWGGPGRHVDSWEEHDAVINRAIAQLSTQPAPVAAKTEREWQLLLNSKAVWIDSRYAYFIPLSDAEEMVTGKPATAAPPASPPPQTPKTVNEVYG